MAAKDVATPPLRRSLSMGKQRRSTLNSLDSTAQQSDTTASTDISKPTWNTSPNTFPAHLIALRRWLPTRVKTFVEYGYRNR